MSFDPSSIIINSKVVELIQYARLNGKLKSLVPEHDNNSNTDMYRHLRLLKIRKLMTKNSWKEMMFLQIFGR